MANEKLPGADSTEPTPEAPGSAEDSVRLERSQGLSYAARIKGFVGRGLTATVIVLALLGAVVTAYAFWVRPDTAVPQPQQSNVEIDFSPGHSAVSPITAKISLSRDYYGKGSVLDIELTGADLAHTGWSIYMTVPIGVRLNVPWTGQVLRDSLSNALNAVVLDPGPQADGRYSTLLIWDDLHSGPMLLDGANLAAYIPDFTVDNWESSGTSNGKPTVPEPQISVTRQLEPDGDFTYVGGQSPDQINNSGWSWKAAQPITINGGGGALSSGVYVEGRSPAAELQSNNAIFKSGIAFGVAASAFIAAIQEFVKSATDSKPRTSRKRTPKVTAIKSGTLQMPMVIGLDLSRARAVLSSAIPDSRFKIRHGDATSASPSMVIAQQPPPGREVTSGSQIRLIVSTGPTAGDLSPPEP